MKHFLVVVLMISCIIHVFAYSESNEQATAQPAFDITCFESNSGYKYDKFDREWGINSGAMCVQYTNGVFLMWFQLDGTANGIKQPPVLYLSLRDDTTNYSNSLINIEAADILIDDILYKFSKTFIESNFSYVFIDESWKEIMEAFQNPHSIDVRLYVEKNRGTVDVNIAETDVGKFSEFCDTVLLNNVWQYLSSDVIESMVLYKQYVTMDVIKY